MPLKRVLYLGLDPTFCQTDGEIIHFPLIKIVPYPLETPEIQHAFNQFSQYTHVVLTSKSTVKILADYLPQFGYSLADWASKTNIVVGKVTAHYLATVGITPHVIAQEETAEGLVHELQKLFLKQAYIFWPRSKQARPVISDFLHCQHISLQECSLYDTYPIQTSQDMPHLDYFDEIIFTSPSTVEAFIQIFGSLPLNKLLTPIGPITKAKLESIKIKF